MVECGELNYSINRWSDGGIDNTRFHNKLRNWGRCTSTAILILICVSILFWTLMEIFQNIVYFIFLQLSHFILENWFVASKWHFQSIKSGSMLLFKKDMSGIDH